MTMTLSILGLTALFYTSAALLAMLPRLLDGGWK